MIGNYTNTLIRKIHSPYIIKGVIDKLDADGNIPNPYIYELIDDFIINTPIEVEIPLESNFYAFHINTENLIVSKMKFNIDGMWNVIPPTVIDRNGKYLTVVFDNIDKELVTTATSIKLSMSKPNGITNNIGVYDIIGVVYK